MASYTAKTYIIFLDLPKDISDYIDNIRVNLNSSGVKRGIAHITLKAEEDLIIDEGKLIGIIEQFCTSLEPFNLILGEIKLHEETERVGRNLHYSIENSIHLRNIVMSLSKIIQEFIDVNSPKAFGGTKWEQSDNYYSHISLINGKVVQDGYKLSKLVNDKYAKIQNQNIFCNIIRLAKWDEKNGKWLDVKEFLINDKK